MRDEMTMRSLRSLRFVPAESKLENKAPVAFGGLLNSVDRRELRGSRSVNPVRTGR